MSHDVCCRDITAVTMETVNFAQSSLSISAAICYERRYISALRISNLQFRLHFNCLTHDFIFILFDRFHNTLILIQCGWNLNNWDS